jgi:hypothetical protein
MRGDAPDGSYVGSGLHLERQKNTMRTQHSALMLLLSFLVGFLLSSPCAAKIRLSSGVRVNSFAEDLKESDGIQTLVPLEALYTSGALMLVVRTSYAQSAIEQPQHPRTELTTLTDTMASVSYTVKGLPVTLTGGLTLNLPTGLTELTADEERMTGGEFDLRQFGEGLNVGVNLNVVKTFGAVTTGLNAAYTIRGEYTPSAADQADQKKSLDPGDQLLLAGKLNWKLTAPVKLGAAAAYLHTTADQVQHTDDFQTGGVFILGQTLEYLPKPFELGLTLQQTLPQNAKYAENGVLRAEPDRGTGQTWLTSATVAYQYSEALTFKVLGSVRLTQESPRKDASNGKPYAGRKQVYSVGPEVKYQVNQAFACQVSASYVMQVKEQSVTLTDDQTTTGFKLNTGVSFTF